jgi:flavin reductase (DIM6/NTAB) family NADH-FMN oxidoreductase RutF
VTDYADLDLDPRVVLRGGTIEADPVFGPSAVDAESFKAAMRLLAAGVVMVTARVGERLWGLTISSCCSISASPPRVLISLAQGASCRPAILATRRFGLSVLQAGQRPLAELGAVPGGRKEVDAFCESEASEGGHPLMIAGALAHLDCTVATTYEVADHTLIIGNVEAAVTRPDPDGPLLYYDRTFHRLGEPIG